MFSSIFRHVSCVAEATQLLKTAVTVGGPQPDQSLRKIRDLELTGDEISRGVIRRLDKRLQTTIPARREDAYRVFSRVDDILDSLDRLAGRILAFQIVDFPAPAKRLVEIIESCSRALVKLIETAGATPRLTEVVLAIHHLKHEAGPVVQRGLRELFSSEVDSIRLMRLMDVHELLEAIVDSFEDTAQALQDATLKLS